MEKTSAFDIPGRTLALFTAAVLAILLALYAIDVALLAFAAILIGIMLRAPATWLCRHVGLPQPLALMLVTLTLFAGLGLAAWSMLPDGIGNLRAIADQVTHGLERMQTWLHAVDGSEFDTDLGAILPPADLMAGKLPGVISTTFGVLGSMALVSVAGIYLAASPAVYRHGLLRLFPPARRESATGLLDELDRVLRRWLLGKALTMILVGSMAWTGLALLEVPMAGGLALLTAIAEFVPYLGPLIALAPVLLVALAESPELMGYALLLYLAIQFVESYLLTPLIQERAVALPPAIVILAQVLMGSLFGIMGVLLATPLAAVTLVTVQRTFIKPVVERS